MDSVKAAQQLLERQSFSVLLPYLAYDTGKKLYTLDSGIGCIFECTPQFAGEDTARVIRGLLESDMPAGTSLQFMLYASPNIKHLLDNYVMAREAVHGESLYTDLARRQRDFFLSGKDHSILKGIDVAVRNFRLIVSMVVPVDKSPDAVDANMETVEQLRETAWQGLNTAGLSPKNMDPEALINLMTELLNPSHPNEDILHYDPKLAIKDQIIYSDTSIEVERDHLKVDGTILKSLTVRQYPQEWDISNGCHFIGDLFANVKQIGVPSIANSRIGRGRVHLYSAKEWPRAIRHSARLPSGFQKYR
jgi:conjugal transfer ATP-binding protein TraC